MADYIGKIVVVIKKIACW